MAQIRLPHQLSKILSTKSPEDKKEYVGRYKTWKVDEITEIMLSQYQTEYKRLIQEDEDESPLSWFQSKWSKAKRLGKRQALRQIILDLGGNI